ncbi:MAG TPA: sigma-70 family RNA polymerase sigma factor [Thermoanaerobaculia bacterium]|nr:sigma-70 family RNA polymerase sigma factor [Thermoanaerobaculia bacterium]
MIPSRGTSGSARAAPQQANPLPGGGADALDRAVERFQAGIDRERNFRLLFERYHGPVAAFFARHGVPPEDRLDLTQETFLRVYRGLATYRSQDRLGSWILRIAATTHLNRLRDRHAAKRAGDEVPLEAVAATGEPRLVSDGAQLDRLLAGERRQRLAEAIDGLPDQMRQCLKLRLEQELEYQEIASVMRLSIDTVKTHLAQGRQRLRERLGDPSREEP